MKIANEVDYNDVMAKIDALMPKGSDNVSKEELAEIRSLALTAQAYEQAKEFLKAVRKELQIDADFIWEHV